MADYIELGKICENCNTDKWVVLDIEGYYDEMCLMCGVGKEIRKSDFLEEFQCQKCNCLEATLEENNNFLATRCKNCGDQNIVLRKHTNEYNKTTLNERKNTPTANTKKCPKCGGTEFTPVRKKYSLLTGFLTNKVDLICNKCGAKVK